MASQLDAGLEGKPQLAPYSNPTEGLLQATFQIIGPGSGGGQTTGTVFIAGRPVAGTDLKRFVLVTAAHVLEGIAGERAVINARTYRNGKWATVPTQINIRNADKPLWARHPKADVAAMYVSLPTPSPMVAITEFATDDVVAQLSLTPGDEVFMLGYPLGVNSQGPGGFAILRSGRIASYPLTPASEVDRFLVDVTIFPGNSGGPVYLWQASRSVKGTLVLGGHFSLLGVVSQEVLNVEKTNSRYQQTVTATPLKLGVVVPALFAREAIMMLPEPTP